MLGACTTSIDYGEPRAPTEEQEEAAQILGAMTRSANATRRGVSDPVRAFEVHSLMARLSALAVRGSENPIWASGEIPPGIHPGCTSGHPSTGFVYSNCITDNGTINGRVSLTPLTVDYDLRISSGSGTDGMNFFELRGHLNLGDGRMIGDLEMRSRVNLPGRGEVAGIWPGDGVGDVNTFTTWDLAFDEAAGCIVDGMVEVEVEAKGSIDGARFYFEGCEGTPWVRNGHQPELEIRPIR
ncbi:MAG: hypothetical protein AAF799_32440 [Myxococcota bacterium]